MTDRQMTGVCDFFTKLVSMAMSLEISEKEVQIDHLHIKVKTPLYGEKIAKIGPEDHEIIVL